MTEKRFQDKVVVVTGAASGIGRAIVTAFARAGAKCVLVDVDQEWAEQVAETLRAQGAAVTVSITDVSQADQVDALMKTALDAYGRLDIFINNAGVGVHKEVVDLTDEDWDYQVDVQLKGPFLCSRAAARQMIRQGEGGRIINIGSTAAGNARVQAAPHCVSKAGVVMLTRVMALELGRHNITVNCVSPGLTDVSEVSRHGGATSEYIGNFLNMVPLGRLAHPEEMANMVLFFASEQAAFITGQNIFVDGGYSAGKLSIQGPHQSTRQ
jgi:NAD(P)-dependent dehydrogenase (short-subunit alcohol dehydrogenase family)